MIARDSLEDKGISFGISSSVPPSIRLSIEEMRRKSTVTALVTNKIS